MSSAGLLLRAFIIRQHMPLQAGTRLGPYEIVALIGAGGMGEVWLATELRLGRKVALKLLPAGPHARSRPHPAVRAGSPRRVRAQSPERLHDPRAR